MEWTESLRNAIAYMEEHLLDDISADDVTVEKMNGFKVIGFEKIFSIEDAWQKIPEFWDEYREKYLEPILWKRKKPENEVEEMIRKCSIAEYGICIDDLKEKGKFRYMICLLYTSPSPRDTR